MDNRKIALSLCDRTGNMLRPWANAGYRCIAVDIQHEPGTTLRNGIEYVGADVMSYIPPVGTYAFKCAFTPCTNFATSGARWFKSKGLKVLGDSILLLARCQELIESDDVPYMVENPVGVVSSFWRQPDYKFDPCDYCGYLSEGDDSDAYTKRTCLWTGGGFIMPAPRPVVPIYGSKMHLLPESANRADERSVTPMGFAIAVFQANSVKRD